jgi:twitching motility protein PilT
MDIAELLMLTVEKGASDLHLTVGAPPSIRTHGDVNPTDFPALSREETHDTLYDIMNETQKARFEETNDLDFSLELSGCGRFRVNVFRGRLGVGAVFRVIPTKIKSAAELGLPPVVENMAHFERGLVLVTGPTGSGKSTTLAALIDYINDNRKGHILTVEDPIEFVHNHKRCLVNQREVGPNTNSFATALRAALREDPDVILVGEMRDLETISLAVSAAETGHLVFGTLHTSSAAQTIDRIIDVFPVHQQAQVRAMLAESLRGVVAQKLMKTADRQGRCAALEIMTATPAVRNLIREGKTYQLLSVMQTSTKDGMQTLDMALRDLLRARVISFEDALDGAPDKQQFLQTLEESGMAVPGMASAAASNGVPGASSSAAASNFNGLSMTRAA